MPIKRSDLARYLLLIRFGGLFLDLDMSLLQSPWHVSSPLLDNDAIGSIVSLHHMFSY
jgi:mannosyltransferase OCH1-like enzyme